MPRPCRYQAFSWPQRRHENPCGQRCSKSAWRQSSSVGYISMKSISVFGCRTIFASLWVAAQEATGGTGRKGMVMCAFFRRICQPSVYAQVAIPDLRLRPDPSLKASLEIIIRDVQVEPTRRNVNGYAVAVLNDGNRSALSCFGRHMPHEAAVVRPGKPAVGDKGCLQCQPSAVEVLHGSVHLRHTGAAARAFVANDHHGTVRDSPPHNGAGRVFFGIEAHSYAREEMHAGVNCAGLVMPESGARLPRNTARPPSRFHGLPRGRIIALSRIAAPAVFSLMVWPVTVTESGLRRGRICFMTAGMPPARWKSGTVAGAAGFILATCGVERHRRSKSSTDSSTPAS